MPTMKIILLRAGEVGREEGVGGLEADEKS